VLLAVAAMAERPSLPMPPPTSALAMLKSAAVPAIAPTPCCLPSKSFQWIGLDVIASWDVHGDNAGYEIAAMQVDQTNNLLYADTHRVNPAPKASAMRFWVTPSAVQGQWYQFFKLDNQPDCYVTNMTTKPDIFDPICFGPPYTYAGDVTVGTRKVSIWEENGGTYNDTHFVEMDSNCFPYFQLGFGLNDAGDIEEKMSNFVDIQLSVSDPSKFIPPSQCKPVLPDGLSSRAARIMSPWQARALERPTCAKL